MKLHQNKIRTINENDSSSINCLEDFYFANTYPNDKVKAINMKRNVSNDLKPFISYINASIDHIGRSTSEGADVREVCNLEKELYLKPQFSIIKTKNTNWGKAFSVPKPQNIYVLTVCSSDDDSDVDSFEVFHRRETICSFKDKVDVYKGSVFLRLPEDNAVQVNAGKFDLYDDNAHKDESIKCEIRPLDYKNIDSYRIDGVKINRIEEEKDWLVFYTDSDLSAISEISFIGEKVPIEKRKIETEREITGKNHRVNHLKDDLYLVQPILTDKKVKFFCDKHPIRYTVLDLCDMPESELRDWFHTKDIAIRNNRIVYSSNKSGTISFGDFDFEIKSEKIRFNKILRNEKSDFIGTVIEVITDSKSIRDFESNTDVFFLESTERLTDKLPFRQENRIFKIGKRDENLNLLEIAEEKDGKLERIKVLPNHLYAVPNDWQLKKQKHAIKKLCSMPCKDIKRLLELFERKAGNSGFCAEWETFTPAEVTQWYILTNDGYDGCEEQREFVRKALATPDFAFLEGPPGTGKTTCILELIAQLIVRCKKVLLTASTNAAVDNILERLNKLPQEIQDKIFAVRIGNEGVISDIVSEYTLSGLTQEYSNEILHFTNVVCGTIYGILKHPDFKLNDRNQPVRQLYDYLIIDESSKTTFQDFLIPALYSKHLVLSGDLMQLTPYVEQDTIQSSLEEMPEFDRNMQFIQTILWLIKDNHIRSKNMRFYMTVSTDLISAAEKLINDSVDMIGIICSRHRNSPYAVSVNELYDAGEKSVILYGAKVLFIENTILSKVRYFIPDDYVPMYDIVNDEQYSDSLLAAITNYYFAKKRPKIELGTYRDRTEYSSYDKIVSYWANAVKDNSWAREITWRICRIQELFLEESSSKTVERYKEDIDKRMPTDENMKKMVQTYCNSITGIALPSILRLLQQGLDKEVHRNSKETTLNSGFDKNDFNLRHVMLSYQHRMHPAISKFSNELIYSGKLKDGSEMSEKRNWTCGVFGSDTDLWINTDETVHKDCINENIAEIDIIKYKISDFIQWSKDNPNPEDPKQNWTVACLTYYRRQETSLKKHIKELFNEQRTKTHYTDDNRHIEVFIYTVDKFQGREADVVFLSFVKSGNVSLGFMDSRNRLNVALTRAKYQRVIVGSRNYFFTTQNKSDLLKQLAKMSNLEEYGR